MEALGGAVVRPVGRIISNETAVPGHTILSPANISSITACSLLISVMVEWIVRIVVDVSETKSWVAEVVVLAVIRVVGNMVKGHSVVAIKAVKAPLVGKVGLIPLHLSLFGWTDHWIAVWVVRLVK